MFLICKQEFYTRNNMYDRNIDVKYIGENAQSIYCTSQFEAQENIDNTRKK
ncbi:unnamed protein product [Paramecium primaurelia]|uniref:Uncharacterized protein n=1 Tax=Paramecium primaurelia TaxID=5886 RepID=A0A8S1MDW2_PARPR|nr:unnamed protein product [Paramecium primaurelia]